MNFQVVVDALRKILADIVNFIPNLINGLIILLVGYLVARLVRWLLAAVLRRARLDEAVERAGLMGALRGLKVQTAFSTLVGQAAFALLLVSFLITSTRIMGLEPVARLFERLLAFLPTLLAALIVFLLGGVVAQFVGRLVAESGAENAPRLGRLLQHVLSLFVVIIALGVMGIDTALLVTAVTIGIASLGLAAGLALGLGARRAVTHIISGYYVRQRFRVGQPIEVAEVSGDVSGIGRVNTVVRTPEGDVVLPNETLVESVVRAPRRRPEGEG
jgi:small-conductance mechanosensitive channel